MLRGRVLGCGGVVKGEKEAVRMVAVAVSVAVSGRVKSESDAAGAEQGR